MRGAPKVYGTVQDFYNVAQTNPAEAAAALQKLLVGRFAWEQKGILDSREDGIEDATHKVVYSRPDAIQDHAGEFVQMELVEDGNSAIFRMGWTVAKAETFISQYGVQGA